MKYLIFCKRQNEQVYLNIKSLNPISFDTSIDPNNTNNLLMSRVYTRYFKYYYIYKEFYTNFQIQSI